MNGFESQKQLLQTLLKSWGADLTPRALLPCSIYLWASKVRPGDHVAVRSVVNGTRDVIWHHGIYVGDEYMVHMHPANNICKVHIDQFMASLPTTGTYLESAGVVQYDGDSEMARAQTVMVAECAVHDETMQRIVYDLVQHQCDGFATWCRTGRCASGEAQRVLAKANQERPPVPYFSNPKGL